MGLLNTPEVVLARFIYFMVISGRVQTPSWAGHSFADWETRGICGCRRFEVWSTWEGPLKSPTVIFPFTEAREISPPRLGLAMRVSKVTEGYLR